jgi:hypothetical protein
MKSRTPKPRYAGLTFPFSHFSYVVVLELTKTRTLKPRNAGTTFPFHISEVRICCSVGHLNSRSSEPRNLKALDQSSPLFLISKVVSVDVWLLYSRNPKLQNPEKMVTFHDFGSGLVLMLAVVFAKS